MERQLNDNALEYKSMVGFRTNWFVCPLPLGCDTYGNCEYGCPMCYCRQLDSHVWKKPFRPGKLEYFKQAFKPYEDSGIALKVGSKSDPYPKVEQSEKVTRSVLKHLVNIDYPFIVNTRSIGFERDLDLIDNLFVGVLIGHHHLPYESPSLPSSSDRMEKAFEAADMGVTVCINAEPLLPNISHDTLEEFAAYCGDSGIHAVNFYNFNFNKYNVQQMGINDAELMKLHDYYISPQYVEDGNFLINRLRTYGVKVGCPDWVNFPYENDCLTCCGFDIEQHEKLSVFDFMRILQEKGELTWGDVESLATEFDRESGHLDDIKAKWGQFNQKEYFLDDLKNITFIKDEGKYLIVEKESWW